MIHVEHADPIERDELCTVWYHPGFNQLGILSTMGREIVSVFLCTFERDHYAILSSVKWLEEDGWELVGDL